MKHKVLILGTLGEFTELVKKAKEKGYETVVCDGYADGIARTYADKAYTIPVTDVDAIALISYIFHWFYSSPFIISIL